MNIKVGGKARISDCYIHPLESNTKLAWRVELAGETTSDQTLDWTIRDKSNSAVLAGGSSSVAGSTCAWTTQTYGMKPWSDNDPALYQIELVLKEHGEIADKHSQSFGLRTLVRAGHNLELNGRPVQLRGTCTYYDFPLTTTAPSDVESYRRIIKKKKDVGFNFIRFHTWVPSQEYMQAADELDHLAGRVRNDDQRCRHQQGHPGRMHSSGPHLPQASIRSPVPAAATRSLSMTMR